ncbi:MAG: hypothetical protein J6R82_03985 [Clostridia bacterium]|nr:hypothetical protein [Clostridia bacterium]
MEQQATQTRKQPFYFHVITVIDAIRVILLVLFNVIAAHYVWSLWVFFPLQLSEYFPTIEYQLRQTVVFAILAIPCITVTLLLIKSVEHLKKQWLVQVILYGCWAVFLIILMLQIDPDGFGMAFVISYIIAAGILFGTQLAVLAIREWLRRVIAKRILVRILGYALLCISIVSLLSVLVALPSYSDFAREANRIFQNPDEYQSFVCRARDEKENVVVYKEITKEECARLLSTIEVNTVYEKNSELNNYVYNTHGKVGLILKFSDDPDDQMYIGWYPDRDVISVTYKDCRYYTNDSAFEEMIAQIPAFIEIE